MAIACTGRSCCTARQHIGVLNPEPQLDDVQVIHCYRAAAQGGAAESVRTLHVDDSTVLKLAIGASLATVAVTTFHGLYLADFSSASGSPGACLADTILCTCFLLQGDSTLAPSACVTQ